jgi:hypothetical protein
VAGRVNMNKKLHLLANIDSTGKLTCTGENGFEMIVDLKGRLKAKTRRIIRSDRIKCRLTDGTVLECEGHIDADTLRLDATDQENYSWFWFAVNRSYKA